jgi:two-component system alkaline phosphatase synthesis response regulator PhoP
MIYYVEDDQAIRNLVLYALTAQNLDVRGFTGAADFRDVCLKEPPDLVLLDIMLPGETGLSILSWIRSVPELRQIPVMMLSAKDSEYDKVLALDSGADDYLAKPFGMMELTSRCRALLRRPTMIASNNSGADDTVTVGCLSLSAKDHRAFAGNEELDLTLKEFELLRKLMDGPGQAFTRARLLEEIWDITFVGSTRTLDTHVQTLRRKLNNASAGAGEAIETVRGVGYRLAREEKP